VRLVSLEGRELGRGLSALSSEEVRQVLGMSSEAAQRTLGRPVGDAVVHRDHLVLTPVPAPAS
jgi:glutamate 5-kinase